MQAYGYGSRRRDSLPRCPVCGGGHYPATNGAGRRVHCDGSPAETAQEQREREERARKREEQERAADRADRSERAKRAKRVHAERKREQERERERERARAIILAERATIDGPPVDAIDASRIPDNLPDTF